MSAGAPPRFVARPGRICAVGVVLLLVVVLLAFLLPSGPLRIDARWSEAMTDIESAALDRIALWFNALGHGILRALTIAVIGLLLLVRRRFVALVAFAVIEALTPLAVNVLKAIVDRPRPPGATITAAASSFPSGHAAYAAATAVAVVVLFCAACRHRWLWVLLAVLFAAGMAWSRTYLQVHWLSDVTAACLLGAGIALLTFAVSQLAVDRHGRGAGAPPPG